MAAGDAAAIGSSGISLSRLAVSTLPTVPTGVRRMTSAQKRWAVQAILLRPESAGAPEVPA